MTELGKLTAARMLKRAAEALNADLTALETTVGTLTLIPVQGFATIVSGVHTLLLRFGTPLTDGPLDPAAWTVSLNGGGASAAASAVALGNVVGLELSGTPLTPITKVPTQTIAVTYTASGTNNLLDAAGRTVADFASFPVMQRFDQAVMTGDSGSGGVEGLVPAPAAGDAAAGKFLSADGTWAVAGGGSTPDCLPVAYWLYSGTVGVVRFNMRLTAATLDLAAFSATGLLGLGALTITAVSVLAAPHDNCLAIEWAEDASAEVVAIVYAATATNDLEDEYARLVPDFANWNGVGGLGFAYLDFTAAQAYTLAQSLQVFSKGGTMVNSSGLSALTAIAWRAPFACTVTNVRGYRVGGSAATINARRNGTDNHLASNLSLGSADTWADGGAVQNTAYAAGDKLEIMLVSVTGATQVAIQVDFTRP